MNPELKSRTGLMIFFNLPRYSRNRKLFYDKDALESTDCGMREGLSNE